VDSWKFESNSGKQILLALACLAVGIILVVGFRHFSGSGTTNTLAGFLLGMLLLIIGIYAFLSGGKQTIFVDPLARHIVVEDSNHFRTKKRLIPFRDVVGSGIGYLGRTSNHVTFYFKWLLMKLSQSYRNMRKTGIE